MSRRTQKNYETRLKELFDGQYTIGLDIGTNSVGWAVIDEKYQIPVYKGKKAWGVRRFDAGMTAENRRLKRGARRRINRRKKRVEFLQETLAPLIQEKDTHFLRALEELEGTDGDAVKKYQQESTRLSIEKVFLLIGGTRKEYQQMIAKYPTMYHLRYDLLTRDTKADIRLIYLALHHIVKKRGHFLQENLELQELKTVSPEKTTAILRTIQPELKCTVEEVGQFLKLLGDATKTRNDRAKESKSINRGFEPFAKALLGMKFPCDKLFSLEEKCFYQFGMDDDGLIEKLGEYLSDEQIDDLAGLEQIFISLAFQNVMKKKNTLSEAKIDAFDTHREQMMRLKRLLDGTTDYARVFLSKKRALTAWERTRDKKNDKRCLYDQRRTHTIDHENFTKELMKIVENHSAHPEAASIKRELEEQRFLMLLNTKENGTIPYQLHLKEATDILRKQQVFHPELTDEMIDRVGKIISFRIPYYVGPLVSSNNKGEFGWMSRKSDQPIRPWNFEETVDRAQSANDFVDRMVGTCTYLLGEKALPKKSLTYQLFEVLNELNVCKVDGEPIHEDDKWELLPLFFEKNKVTHKDAEKRLGKGRTVSGTVLEKGFANSLSSWNDMAKVLGPIRIEDVFGPYAKKKEIERFEMMEKIVRWLTVFNEKRIFLEKMETTYPEIAEDQRRALASLSYTGWGRLSDRLLLELPAKTTQQNLVETLLYQVDAKGRPLGFQRIVTDDHLGFQRTIGEINGRQIKERNGISFSMVEELAGSKALKRGIWQALEIIREIESIFGTPKAISIETAREDGVKKRTTSREQVWEELSKALKHDSFAQEMKAEDLQFQNERVWLYLMQKGRCLYSDEKLELHALEQYEVDHIIPYSLSTDDSMDNKALVKKQCNQDKGGDKMPLQIMNGEQAIRMRQMWRTLAEQGFLSPKKLNNLHKPEITADMAAGFINRQLVETRQITKHVIQLLTQRYAIQGKQPHILGLKAQMNDKVKKHLGLVKIREANDKHHAVDAYMAALIHQFLDVIGKGEWVDGKQYWKKIRTEKGAAFDEYRRKNTWINQELKKRGLVAPTGEKLTESTAESIYSYVLEVIDAERFCVTYKTGTQSEDKKFWNETLYSPKAKKNTMPATVGKQFFGLYDSVKTDRTIMFTYEKAAKKGPETFVGAESLSRFDSENVMDMAAFIEEKMKGTKKFVSGSVKVVQVFESNDLIEWNGHPLHILSSTAFRNAKQTHFPQMLQKALVRNNPRNDEEKREQGLVIDRLLGMVLDNFPFLSDGQVGAMCTSCEAYAALPESEKPARFEELKKQLMTVSKADSGRVDAWKGAGRIALNDWKKAEHLDLVKQSVTGLREKRIPLIRNGKVLENHGISKSHPHTRV